jgi:pSer/pThr/pTyr-binding forkhead associated (FHA) protein
MALSVVVRSGDVSSVPQITFDAPRIVIGRGEGCEVRLPDRSISHRHASIRQRGTEYIVVDEGSSNGTYVGPVRLSPHAPRVLRSGDLLRVGRIWLEIRIEQAVPTNNVPQATKEMALSLVAAALEAEGEAAAARVSVVEGPDAGRELLVGEFERNYLLGRGGDVALTLDDPDASRRHAELFRRGDQLCIRDLGSKNGTRLGDRQLEPGKDTLWPRGESLRIGADRLVYVDPVAEALGELERAADEHMPLDESVDPPTGLEPTATPDSDLEVSAPLPEAAQKSALPIVEVPRKRAAKKRGFGPNLTDALIALVALIVVALSVLGLIWLFRSD